MSQTQGTTTCRAMACTRLVRNAKTFLKTRGRDTQIPVHFNPDEYCSFSCQVRQKQISHLRRIDRILQILFLDYSDMTNPFPVISDRVVRDIRGSRREIVAVGRFDHPDRVSLLEDSFLSLGGKLAFLSLNSCTAALIVFAALMAYLCEDLHPSIEIHEAHIDNVQSDQEVHVLYLPEYGIPLKVHVAKIHSMFQITAIKEDNTTVLADPAHLNGTGIYCDTTAAQYGRAAGLQDAKAYHHRHKNSKTLYSTSLGYYHREHHLKELDPARAESAKSHVLALRQEAYIRTINNVACEESKALVDVQGCST